MKTIVTTGKRKQAIAKAVLKEGKGRIRINHVPLEFYKPEMCQLKIREPLILTGDHIMSKLDIDVNVSGGGVAGQAEAARLAIARALVEYDDKLEDPFQEYDRQLLVADIRRKEPSKPNSHGAARSKVQKSYR